MVMIIIDIIIIIIDIIIIIIIMINIITIRKSSVSSSTDLDIAVNEVLSELVRNNSVTDR